MFSHLFVKFARKSNKKDQQFKPHTSAGQEKSRNKNVLSKLAMRILTFLELHLSVPGFHENCLSAFLSLGLTPLYSH